MYLYADQGLGLSPLLPLLTAGCSQTRVCCVLAPFFITDLASLGTHRASNEINGIIYTGGAGFIDTSHVRHCCDDTKRVYDQLAAARGVPKQVSTSHGVATITKTVPASMWTQVARAIAYSDAVGYEIETYWDDSPGGHNSGFSPEDLCSNYLGTFIAETAINTAVVGSGADFNATVTATLNSVLTVLKAQPKAETQNAFNLVMNCWMSPHAGYSKMDRLAWGLMTLKRRNFSVLPIVPWKVGHPSDVLTPAWVTQGLGVASTYYAYSYTQTASRKPLAEANFAAEIAKIEQNAAIRYPSPKGKHGQPSCP